MGIEKIDADVLIFLRESNAIEDVFDAQSLDDALKAWKYLMQQDEMTQTVVLLTHKILMKNQTIANIDKGHYRRCQVWVGRHEAIKHTEIQGAMVTWMNEMNRSHPAIEWKPLHVEYERIHPFIDGNGRTGRMFMNWHRIKKHKMPLLVIDSHKRSQYYKWFKV